MKVVASIGLEELAEMADRMSEELVKGVVDGGILTALAWCSAALVSELGRRAPVLREAGRAAEADRRAGRVPVPGGRSAGARLHHPARWDAWQRAGVPIALVLSGSALSFMDGLLAHGSPLYGRAAYRPLLLPLDLWSAAEFTAPRTPPEQLIERYAVVGGTPQYQVWAGHRRVEAVIKEALLAKGSPLYEEPLNLLRSQEGIRDAGTYFAALSAIAHGDNRTGRIAMRAQVHTSAASRMLDRLRELGYVEQREPVAPTPDRARAFWRISDPYFRFWFRFVFSNRSRLERAQVDEVFDEIWTSFGGFVSYVFEDCCRTWVGTRSQFAGTSREVGSWWSRKGDAEIDVAAMGKDGYTLLGSCKWREREVGESVLDELYQHRALLGPKAAQARLALFARRAFSAGVRARAARENVLLVAAADLFGQPAA